MKTETTNGDISLSAAVLAPLNAIFEAQIHAARAFLNFVLQMGFRHRYSEAEKESLRQQLEATDPASPRHQELKHVLEEIAKTEDAAANVQPIVQKIENGEALTDEEDALWREYHRDYGELYQQCFRYIDGGGERRAINMPNLALLPIQPLTIDSAKFNFEMHVSDASGEYDQMGSVPGLEGVGRPWYLVKPRSIRGDITSAKTSESSKTIKIELNVKSGDMPYGLHKFLSSLTDVADDQQLKTSSTI